MRKARGPRRAPARSSVRAARAPAAAFPAIIGVRRPFPKRAIRRARGKRRPRVRLRARGAARAPVAAFLGTTGARAIFLSRAMRPGHGKRRRPAPSFARDPGPAPVRASRGARNVPARRRRCAIRRAPGKTAPPVPAPHPCASGLGCASSAWTRRSVRRQRMPSPLAARTRAASVAHPATRNAETVV
jgi:hypothetical protein